MNSKELGVLGEKVACDYLKNKGYRIIDRNYSKKWRGGPQKGEIDIVVKPRRNIFDILRGKKDNTIHFVEVKTSSFVVGSEFLPEERVNFSKQRKLIKLAQNYLLEKKLSFDIKWQIDVIGILIDSNSKKTKIQHFENIVADIRG